MANDLTLYEQQWAEQATEITQHERVQGALSFSTRAGALTLGEERMPGDQVCVIILDNTLTYRRGDAAGDHDAQAGCLQVRSD